MRLRLLVLASISLWACAALAKPAQCFSTDDGYYSCNFRSTDSAGSFVTSARGYPTYTINVDSPGRASGFGDFGSGNVSLPGEYIRSSQDAACWDNTDTGTQICAW